MTRTARPVEAFSCLAVIAAAAMMLAGCTNEAPPPGTPAPSGVISSNGGGVRTLGNQPNIGVTTTVRP